jgi:glucokinase
VIVRSDHVPGWEQVALQDILEAAFDAPVRIDNDGNVGALGELHFGAGRGCQDMFYITVSTGVGGGWIINGRPLRGHNQMAGEIGHVVIDPHGPQCLCGKRGCVERYASGPFMARDAQQQLDQHPERGAVLRQLTAEETVVTGKHVAQAAAQGDDIAGEILQRGAWAVGIGIGNAANLFNPQRFILGGGITKSGPLWWEGVHRAARATALSDIELNIVPAELGDDAPLWGAVALVADL